MTENSIFTIVPLERRSLSRGGEVFAVEEYKSLRCMQEKSALQRIYFLPLTVLAYLRSWPIFGFFPGRRRNCLSRDLSELFSLIEPSNFMACDKLRRSFIYLSRQESS